MSYNRVLRFWVNLPLHLICTEPNRVCSWCNLRNAAAEISVILTWCCIYISIVSVHIHRKVWGVSPPTFCTTLTLKWGWGGGVICPELHRIWVGNAHVHIPVCTQFRPKRWPVSLRNGARQKTMSMRVVYPSPKQYFWNVLALKQVNNQFSPCTCVQRSAY